LLRETWLYLAEILRMDENLRIWIADKCNAVDAPRASVTFEPGARTAWHMHPLGQTLIVTAGCGWTQVWGGPVEEIRPGDVVWFPPGEKHWHGATTTTAMTHIAIQEQLDGKTADWMEKVNDEQYQTVATCRPSSCG
jgi:quercetin dioxygenase-like cupin family protein